MADTARPYVDTRSGSVVRLPASAGVDAERYVPIDEADAAAEERAAQYDRPWAAAGAAALRGVTLGASDYLLTETGTVAPQTLSGLRAENPIASIGGEAVGGVASALIPGAPVARAGAVAARIASAVPQGGKLAALAARAVASAVEGGAVGAGQALTRYSLDEGPTDARSIARDVVGGAALGALTTLGVAGAGVAARGAVSVAERVASIGAKPSVAAQFAADMLEHGGAGVTGGMTARIELQRELENLKGVLGGLRQRMRDGTIDDAGREAVARGEQRIKAIGAEIGAIDADMVPSLAKRAATRRTEKERIRDTTSSRDSAREVFSVGRKTKESWKHRTREDVRETVASRTDAVRERVQQKVVAGEALDAEEASRAIEDELTHLYGEVQKVEGVAQTLRRELRRYWNVGSTVPGARMGITPDSGDRQLAELALYRDVLEERINSARRVASEQRRAAYALDGAEMLSAGAGTRKTVTGSIDDATSTYAREASEAVRSDVSSMRGATSLRDRTVTEVTTKPKNATAAQRVASLQATQTPISREVLEAMAASETRGDLAQFFAWKSAPTILGAAVGGVPGAIIGAALTSPTLQRVAGAAVGRLMAAGSAGAARYGRAARAALVGATLHLSADDAEIVRESALAPHNDPAAVESDALAGYRDAGMPDDMATRMAQYQAARAEVVRDAASAATSRPGRDALGRTLAAVGDPRSITSRLGVPDALTREDVDVLRRVYPEIYAMVVADARQALARRSSELISPGLRRNMLLLVGDVAAVRESVAALQRATEGAADDDGPLTRGMARASATLGRSTQTQLGAAQLALSGKGG